ncbi:MAG: hypothetical protein GXY25_00120 [Pirellulaceae bacterium]|nr:hypothetical protein [Thermoguttaceae bacterium]NLY98922.1 hypothetical protein [Pirellulaceae bacterium]
MVEHLRVFRHVGFFVSGDSGRSQTGGEAAMHADDLSPASRGLRDQQVRFATCDQQTTRRFAQETGRYRLRHFDPPRPDPAIFPYHDGQPPTDGNCAVYEQYRRGESVEALAQRFSQSRTRICRIINELRAARITGLPLDHIGGEEFARLLSRKQEAEILAPLPESDLPTKTPRLPSGLPSYLAGLYEVPLLTREQEMHLFRKMNYLKYKACTLRAQLDLHQPKSRRMDRIEKLYDASVTAKNQIIRANLLTPALPMFGSWPRHSGVSPQFLYAGPRRTVHWLCRGQ